MISIEDGQIKISGTQMQIMEEFMDLTTRIYYKVLKADKDEEMDEFFRKSVDFAVLSTEKQEKELLKMKNKNTILEKIIKKLEEGEE